MNAVAFAETNIPKYVLISKNSGFLLGLWSQSLELVPKNFEWWSRSLKFEFPFNRHIWHSKPIVQIAVFFSFQWTKSFWNQSEKVWMPLVGVQNLSFGSTVLVPTTANLAPGFYLQVFKAGCKLVSFSRIAFPPWSCSCHDDCSIFYTCAVPGWNLLSNIFRGKLR